MGEEYGETSPFQYFTSHSDPALVEAVRRGRREELATFNWEGEPPDPQDEATFQKSKLNHDLRRGGHHRVLVEFYKELIRLRKEVPALRLLSKEHMELPDSDGKKVLMLRRWSETGEAVAVFHFGKEMISTSLPIPSGGWRKKLDSADTRWLGPGSQISDSLTSEGEASITLTPQSFVLLLSGG
jgi:maltooligosyltrehalose trehalohydrolase